jgi:Putative auto-transporter adhesin, head GIN domain
MQKIIFLFIIFSQSISAQVSKKLNDFTKVTSFDQISVFMIAATENKIEISGTNADKVELIYENNELLKGNDILAKVYYTKLEAIEANEGSNIGFDSPVKAVNFDILVKEASSISITLTSKKVVARITQGSRLDLDGTIDTLDVVVNSASKLKADTCKTIQTTVSVNAGAIAVVNASDLVDAKVRAGGTISIYGKPKQVNQKTILGGDIIVNNQ